MRVRRADGVKRDVKALAKNYHSIHKDLLFFERLLQQDFTHSHNRYEGLQLTRNGQPAAIYKASVQCEALRSKLGGIRYAYERITNASGVEYAVALAIYVHQKTGAERDNRNLIRERHESFDGSELDQLFTPELFSDFE